MTSHQKFNYILYGILAFIAAGSAALVVWECNHPKKCVVSTTVADITSLNGRLATIKLSNGETRVVHHVRLNKGDHFCAKWEIPQLHLLPESITNSGVLYER